MSSERRKINETPVKRKRPMCTTTHRAVLPPPCGMPGVVDRTGSALRTKRTGLRYLRLGFLLGCTRADFGFTLTRGATRVVGRRRGPATSGGDFQPRLPAPTSRGDVELRFPPRVRSRLPPATRVLGAYGLRVGSRITARVRLEGELGLRAVLGCASYWAALLGCVN